jgi:hypothetical protein
MRSLINISTALIAWRKIPIVLGAVWAWVSVWPWLWRNISLILPQIETLFFQSMASHDISHIWSRSAHHISSDSKQENLQDKGLFTSTVVVRRCYFTNAKDSNEFPEDHSVLHF